MNIGVNLDPAPHCKFVLYFHSPVGHLSFPTRNPTRSSRPVPSPSLRDKGVPNEECRKGGGHKFGQALFLTLFASLPSCASKTMHVARKNGRKAVRKIKLSKTKSTLLFDNLLKRIMNNTEKGKYAPK